MKKPVENNSKLEEALSKCVKCGACQAVCPVYGIEKKENAVARGKIALLQAYIKDEIELSDKLYESVSQCLLCTSCRESCAAGIDIERIISSAREKAVKEKGQPPLKKAVLEILSGTFPGRNRFMKSASLIERVLLKKIPSESGIFYKGYFLGKANEQPIPAIAPKPFTEIIKKINSSSEKPSVLFFQGCTINFLNPETGVSALNIIEKSGFNPTVLAKQYCCGLPAFFSGDSKQARKLAEKNIDMLESENFEYLVAACATCGSAFKEIYPMIFEDDKRRSSLWEKLKKNTLDLSEFVTGPGRTVLSKINKNRPTAIKKITYHDPCHLKKTQKIEKEPREIIKMLPGIEFVEMRNSTDCCGFGGMFSLENYNLSLEINKKKTENIIKSGADKVLTGCPGCILQINSGLISASQAKEVKHWCQLLDEATDNTEI